MLASDIKISLPLLEHVMKDIKEIFANHAKKTIAEIKWTLA